MDEWMNGELTRIAVVSMYEFPIHSEVWMLYQSFFWEITSINKIYPELFWDLSIPFVPWFQHGYRAANSGHGAPPPYPGRGGGHGGHGGGPSGGGAVPRPGSSAIPGGPGRGYGEGRGHYNRSKNEQYNPNGSSHPMNQMAGPHGASRGSGREGGANGSGHIGPRDSRAAGGPDRSSRNRNNGNRGSRIEMSPLRWWTGSKKNNSCRNRLILCIDECSDHS